MRIYIISILFLTLGCDEPENIIPSPYDDNTSTVSSDDARASSNGVATQDFVCKQSLNCQTSGQCSSDGEKCIAMSDADCSAYPYIELSPCRLSGACTAVDGICKPRSTEDCEQSSSCRVAGKCDLIEHPTAGILQCGATSNEHCEQSELCESMEYCNYNEITGSCSH